MKILLYLCLAISVYFLIGIIKVLAFDMERLTQYGWGYVTGQIVLLLLFSALSLFLFRKGYGKAK